MSKPNPEPSTAEEADDWGSRRHVRTLVLMGATGFGIYLCYRLAAPFLPALVWASALAILFAPLQGWLESKLRRPTLAAMGVVPVLGTFVVWVPAAIFLALEGHWGSALILALWGLLVVSTVDNLLRPILVGNRLKLHTVLVFLSIVGGLLLFGAAGFILGPVILTVTLVLLESWTSPGRSGVEVNQANSGPGGAS